MPTLRDWQTKALKSWEDNNFSGCFEVATGGGKTFFAITAFKKILLTQPNLRAVVIVPTQALLDQWFLAFVDDFGYLESEIKTLKGKDIRPDAKINLSIINTARKFDSQSKHSGELMLIVDECHRAGSPENSKALIHDCAATIGLSATPYREYDDGFEERVAPVLGQVIAKYTLQNAIKDGVLAKLKLQNIKVPMLPSENDDYARVTYAIGKAFAEKESPEKIRALLIKRARIANNAFFRVPVAAAVVGQRSGIRTIVFLESIASAQSLFTKLDGQGVSVAIYHSKMGVHLRRANLRAFRKGIFDVLIACRALDEGFNVPEAEVAVIAAGTASKRQRVQRIGRVLRSFGEKVNGTVVTLYATKHEESRLQTECEQFAGLVPVEWASVNLGK